jgi:hypothetical protein
MTTLHISTQPNVLVPLVADLSASIPQFLDVCSLRCSLSIHMFLCIIDAFSMAAGQPNVLVPLVADLSASIPQFLEVSSLSIHMFLCIIDAFSMAARRFGHYDARQRPQKGGLDFSKILCQCGKPAIQLTACSPKA